MSRDRGRRTGVGLRNFRGTFSELSQNVLWGRTEELSRNVLWGRTEELSQNVLWGRTEVGQIHPPKKLKYFFHILSKTKNIGIL